jgi:hypothetical protein
MDGCAPQVTELLEVFAKKRGFMLDPRVKQSAGVLKHITQTLQRADREHKNSHMATQLLEDAIMRQTERVRACILHIVARVVSYIGSYIASYIYIYI